MTLYYVKSNHSVHEPAVVYATTISVWLFHVMNSREELTQASVDEFFEIEWSRSHRQTYVFSSLTLESRP